ncbi:MAG: hypothetical protein WBE76_11245 [Terracidiphilus sp.]
MAYQVIKFVMLQFDENWKQLMQVTGYSNFQYTANAADARLTVVFEGATGVMETYFFRVPSGESVYVLDQVVHIPAKCQSQEDGRGIKCG